MGVTLQSLFRIGNANLLQQLYRPLMGLLLAQVHVVTHSLHQLLLNGHSGVQAGHGVLEYHGNTLALDGALHLLS